MRVTDSAAIRSGLVPTLNSEPYRRRIVVQENPRPPNPHMKSQLSLPKGPLQKTLRSSLPGAASTSMFRACGDSGVEMPRMTSPEYDKCETCHWTKMPISFSSPINRDANARGAGVTAVLGPTNTGKTHLAIERMLGHSSGIIGL